MSRLAHTDFDDDDDDDDSDDDNDSNNDDDDEEDDLVAACLSVLLPVLSQTGEWTSATCTWPLTILHTPGCSNTLPPTT